MRCKFLPTALLNMGMYKQAVGMTIFLTYNKLQIPTSVQMLCKHVVVRKLENREQSVVVITAVIKLIPYILYFITGMKMLLKNITHILGVTVLFHDTTQIVLQYIYIYSVLIISLQSFAVWPSVSLKLSTLYLLYSKCDMLPVHIRNHV